MDIFQAMRVYVRVVDTGSFTVAARVLNLSTAQVSRLVSELESHLQARLLQRTTRRLRLTDVGARYLERCRLILNELEEAGAEASGAHLKPQGRLRVHSLIGLGTQMLAPMAAHYGEHYPDVNVQLTLSQRQPDLLEEGHDVVIIVARGLPDSELVGQHLGKVGSVVCAAPAYLARHGTPRTLDDLKDHRCLHMADPVFDDNWTFTLDGREHTVRLGETFQVNVAEAMAQAASAAMGICLLPDFIAAKAFQEKRLVRLLAPHSLNERDIYALYPSRRFLDAKVKTWVEFLKAEIPRELRACQQVVEDPLYWA